MACLAETTTWFEPADVIRMFLDLWESGAKRDAIALFADDAVFAFHVPQHVLPFAGETRGRASISDRLMCLVEQFDTEVFNGPILRTSGDQVHAHVHFCTVHRVTGQRIEGRTRIVAVVREGQIARWDEYHDADKFAAFMRLVSQEAADQF